MVYLLITFNAAFLLVVSIHVVSMGGHSNSLRPLYFMHEKFHQFNTLRIHCSNYHVTYQKPFNKNTKLHVHVGNQCLIDQHNRIILDIYILLISLVGKSSATLKKAVL